MMRRPEGTPFPCRQHHRHQFLNATLETAAAVGSPVIVQLSNGGAAFYAQVPQVGRPAGAGSGQVSAAHHVHGLAEAYGVPVVLHTDHCARKLLPWIDGLLDAEKPITEPRGSRSSLPT